MFTLCKYEVISLLHSFIKHSDVNMDRHLVCEPCGGNVLGGYDPKKKQVRCTEHVLSVHSWDCSVLCYSKGIVSVSISCSFVSSVVSKESTCNVQGVHEWHESLHTYVFGSRSM